MLLLRFGPLTVPAVTDWLLSHQKTLFDDSRPLTAIVCIHITQIPYYKSRKYRMTRRWRPTVDTGVVWRHGIVRVRAYLTPARHPRRGTPGDSYVDCYESRLLRGRVYVYEAYAMQI